MSPSSIPKETPSGSNAAAQDEDAASGSSSRLRSVYAAAGRRGGQRGPGARRRRRRRRILIAFPLLGLVAWAVVSYAVWMVQPTSMSWSERSAEWVRADVPFWQLAGRRDRAHLLHDERASQGRAHN